MLLAERLSKDTSCSNHQMLDLTFICPGFKELMHEHSHRRESTTFVLDFKQFIASHIIPFLLQQGTSLLGGQGEMKWKFSPSYLCMTCSVNQTPDLLILFKFVVRSYICSTRTSLVYRTRQHLCVCASLSSSPSTRQSGLCRSSQSVTSIHTTLW